MKIYLELPIMSIGNIGFFLFNWMGLRKNEWKYNLYYTRFG